MVNVAGLCKLPVFFVGALPFTSLLLFTNIPIPSPALIVTVPSVVITSLSPHFAQPHLFLIVAVPIFKGAVRPPGILQPSGSHLIK